MVTTDPIVSTIWYDISGKEIGGVSSLSFGTVAPSQSGTVQVVRLMVQNVSLISSLKIGIVGASVQGIPVSSIYLVGHSSAFNSTFVPTEFFPGINTTNTLEDPNNIAVGIGPDLVSSDYIYLSINSPDTYLGSGECVFRWFFTYST